MEMNAGGAGPLVSVIIPTRNRSALLRRAVASVLAQTYGELELIVVNDASTDDTAQVLSEIRDPRLRVIHREINRGAAAARNAGIALARGALVAFNDDDDQWLVTKLEKQVGALQSAPPEVGWCLCGSIRLKPDELRYIGGEHFIRQLDYRHGVSGARSGLDWGMIATPGWLVRKDLLDRVGGFDERMRSYDDWELGLRLWQITKWVIVDEPLWVQDWLQGGGLTRAERARSDDVRLIMQKHGQTWAGNKRVLARHWYIIGRGENLYDGGSAGREALRTSLKIRPLYPRAWAALFLSFLGPAFMRKLTMAVRRLRSA